MRRAHILFLAATASLGVLLVLFSIFTAPSDTTLAAPSSGYTFDELLEGNLLPFAQEINCTVSVTTTDSLDNTNTSSNNAVSLSDYDNLALVADTEVPTDSKSVAVHDDWFRLDNADVGSTYEVEALPDYTTNYNLGIEVYDADLELILSDSNAVDNNQAKVTLVPETQGPYFFKVFQISQQCSGRTYDLETSFTAPTSSPSPTPSEPTEEDDYEQNDDFTTAYTLPVKTSVTLSGQRGKANFYPPNDDDWFKYWTKNGFWYQVETLDLSGVDTYLEIRDRDNDVVETDDDGGGGYASFAEWEATYDGYYYIRIANQVNTTGDYDMQVNESAAPATATPGPTPTGPVFDDRADSCEDNLDFANACVLPVNVSKTFNFVPPYKNGPDNDFYKIWVKPGLHYRCFTSNLDAGIDPNMIVFSAPSWDAGIGGNDDVAPGDFNSSFSYYSTYDGWLYVLVGTGDRTPSNVNNSSYTLECEMRAPGTPTSTPGPGPTNTPRPTTPPDDDDDDGEEAEATPTPEEEEARATSTPAPNLTIRALTTPTPVPEATTPAPRFIPINLLVYYDGNDDHQPGAGEGIGGVSAQVYEVATNQLLGQGYTDEQGNLPFTVSAKGAVRVSVPFFGFSQLVTGESSIYLRVPPQK